MTCRRNSCLKVLFMGASVVLYTAVVIVILVYSLRVEKPTDYAPGDKFDFKMGPVASPKSLVKWPYYWYPFPRGPGYQSTKQAFIDAFMSMYSFGDSGYRDVTWDDDTPCMSQSTLTNQSYTFFDQIELNMFHDAIEDGYRVQPYIDDVKMLGPYDGGSGWWWGVEIGSNIGAHVLLNNHLDIIIDVDKHGQVIKAIGIPRHTDSVELCGQATMAPNHPVDLVQWSYRTQVRRTDKSRDDMNKIVNDMIGTETDRIAYVSFYGAMGVFLVECLVFGYIIRHIIKTNEFDVKPLQNLIYSSPGTGGRYTDALTLSQSSSENLVDVEMFDTDFSVHEQASSSPRNSAGNARYLLKTYRHVVMGASSSPRLLAVLVSSSMQLLFVILSALILSTVYEHSWNNLFANFVVLLLPTTGGISGYICTAMLIKWRVRLTACTHISTIIVVTVPLYIVFFMITSYQMLYRDAANIIALFFTLVALLVINAITYTVGMLGAYYKYKRPEPVDVIDLIPPFGQNIWKQISIAFVTISFVALTQGIGAVYVGTLIVSTPWSTQVKQENMFTFVLLTMWLISGALASINATYINLVHSRNPHWHWPTYAMGPATGLVVCLSSLIYTFDKVTYVDTSTNMAVIIYNVVASFACGIVLGAVSWISNQMFFNFIYRLIGRGSNS